MRPPNRPPVHVWTYNHPLEGISDQLDFLVLALQQHGYPVSVGDQPSETSLNVVIENFSVHSKEVLMDFCRSSRKRVAVVMTEHLDFDGHDIFIHGTPLWTDNDYMHPETQVARIRHLFDCLPHLRCFFVLGDLPRLRNMKDMLPGMAVRSIPFPRLDSLPSADPESSGAVTCDLLFTGHATAHRTSLLTLLRVNGFDVVCPGQTVTKERRDALNRSARLVLNLPQREDWNWLSLMRVVAALRCGRPTVSLGTNDDSRIAACCRQLDCSAPTWADQLRGCLHDWRDLYVQAIQHYSALAVAYERETGFPDDLFEYWSITDRVS